MTTKADAEAPLFCQLRAEDANHHALAAIVIEQSPTAVTGEGDELQMAFVVKDTALHVVIIIR
jgi:hypothetical protein